MGNPPQSSHQVSVFCICMFCLFLYFVFCIFFLYFVFCICALTSWISHLSSLWNWRHFSAWISGMRTWKSFCWINLIFLLNFQSLYYLFLFCPFINNQMLYLGNTNLEKFTLDLFLFLSIFIVSFYFVLLSIIISFINNQMLYADKVKLKDEEGSNLENMMRFIWCWLAMHCNEWTKLLWPGTSIFWSTCKACWVWWDLIWKSGSSLISPVTTNCTNRTNRA